MGKLPRTFTWLHLSDFHARTKGGWDSRRVITTLVDDLKFMSEEHGLAPDCIFFTGDAAFGSIEGETMSDQYERVKEFFEAVRKAFSPEIPTRRIYVVPGNHDIDRNEVTPDQTSWLRDPRRTLADITAPMEKSNKQWSLWLDRLNAYRNFIASYKLTHLGLDDPHLIWGDAIDIGEMRVGIAGFNTAWSCINEDKGKLWFGAEFQTARIIEKMGPVDFKVALLHHPANWLTDKEDPHIMRQLRQEYPVILHGHEHQEWVDPDDTGRLIVSAGACYDSTWMPNGYSFGRIDYDTQEAQIWLRQWDRSGGGWVDRNVAKKTKNGIWHIHSLTWLSPKPDVAKKVALVSCEHSSRTEVAQHYTGKFCENVCHQHDVLELFGCDIPRELQRHKLSVAYVSLNLSAEKRSQENLPLPSSRETAQPEIMAEPDYSASVDDALDTACEGSGRLLILGPAGAGKTTLLRWCAIEAARGVLQGPETLVRIATSDHLHGQLEEWYKFRDENAPGVPNSWRWKIPILIRLRDCPDGKLPPTPDLPKFLGKHLPSAPQDWMTNIFENGRALVLLDGVDEVNRDKRLALATEIEELINTYPNCSYVITTRPGAVENGWLEQLDFVEARVEPMARRDRAEFIDKWYRSATLTIKRLRAGEDLIQTAQKLKTELEDRPDLGILATNPLLCAMICALYRERQDKLPESPAELSEALCQMLLHRRERETPVLSSGEHYPHGWRELQYEQKKGLLSKIAWEMMIGNEPSSMLSTKAGEIVGRVLSTTPGHKVDEAGELMQALIERSGLLRLASDDRIDFLHNTLKEYLAACNAVEIGNPDELVKRADDPAWQPVILFALALAPEQFSSTLVKALLAPAPDRRGRQHPLRGKLQKQKVAVGKARDFFLVRCGRSAKWLAADLSKTIEKIGLGLFPPANMDEVEALAQLGPRWLVQAGKPLLDPNWWVRQKTATIVLRGLRLLRLIGSPRAQDAFAAIENLPFDSTSLRSEWVAGSSELHPEATLKWPFSSEEHIFLSSRIVTDLRPLRAVSKASSLYLEGVAITSLEGIQGLKNLRELSAYRCRELRDMSALRSLKNLHTLNIGWGNNMHNLDPLGGTHIKELSLVGDEFHSLAGINDLKNLKALALSNCFNLSLHEIFTWLATGPQLGSLKIRNCPKGHEEFAWTKSRLGILVKLKTLVLSSVQLSKEMLDSLSSALLDLKHVSLEDISGINSLEPLASFFSPKLRSLSLRHNDFLNKLDLLVETSFDNLETLDLSFCSGLSDLSILKHLHAPNLKHLGVYKCGKNVKARNSIKELKKFFDGRCLVEGPIYR
ncbi:NACHT domain-containing protein [Prosthecobacter sp.]|uniref:NACHT domain-containing protein n=1 Tax=Prosthecobacter sp. TaxID=1965333 RepID=UPI002623A547|nr:NACHT domain-containing protein [Prosthecobacter sp.]